LLFSLSVYAQTGIVSAEAPVKPTLMVLGSYHFANPGKDVIKATVTDVSTLERQREITEMIERLEKYRPTKIAVECDVETSAPVQERFAKYLTGNYQLSVNEREQLGFRLAKSLKDKKIYCVDTNTNSPGNPADYNYFEYAAKHPELNALLKSTRKKNQDAYDRRNEQFINLPIIKQFLYLNDPIQIENDHAGYFYLLRIGEGGEYIGANWLASWYNRNFKIIANIIRIVDSPQDRVLAIYGAGHLKLLNQITIESRYFKIESPSKYLKN
jgi:Family of unknown function (DUF5694)